MIDSKSKDMQRFELNNAIAAFIAGGGRIRKLAVQNHKEPAEKGVPADFLESFSDIDDCENNAFIRVIKKGKFSY